MVACHRYRWLFAAEAGVILFNRSVLKTLPIGLRMIGAISTSLLTVLVPLIITILNKDSSESLGFEKEHIRKQIIIGICIAFILSFLFTLIPHLAGLSMLVDNGKRYTQAWQFAYEILYCLIAVSLTEEFVFRGFIYQKCRAISGSETTAIIVSSFLFGVSHLLNGNIIQALVTALLGILWCILRLKIKDCTTLSLIIANSIYDFLITVWTAVFLSYNPVLSCDRNNMDHTRKIYFQTKRLVVAAIYTGAQFAILFQTPQSEICSSKRNSIRRKSVQKIIFFSV